MYYEMNMKTSLLTYKRTKHHTVPKYYTKSLVKESAAGIGMEHDSLSVCLFNPLSCQIVNFKIILRVSNYNLPEYNMKALFLRLHSSEYTI